MSVRLFPPANTTAQWWEDKFPRTTMRPVTKLLLHTTETKGWPSYEGGATAPTLTYNPWAAAGKRWRQHCYLDSSARALRDPSGTQVHENRDGVVQVEITCYCDPALYAKYGHGVNKLPDSAYDDLGQLLAYLHTHYDVPLGRATKWATFPPPDSIRMTGPQYDRFAGVLGHQHASGNTHGDPGMTPQQVDRILAAAERHIGAGTTSPKPTPQPTEDDDVTLEELLNAHIKAPGPDGKPVDMGSLNGVLWTLMARTKDDDNRTNQILKATQDLTAAVTTLGAKLEKLGS